MRDGPTSECNVPVERQVRRLECENCDRLYDELRDEEKMKFKAEDERDALAERVSFLSCLCVRAVAEGWTVAQVMEAMSA